MMISRSESWSNNLIKHVSMAIITSGRDQTKFDNTYCTYNKLFHPPLSVLFGGFK